MKIVDNNYLYKCEDYLMVVLNVHEDVINFAVRTYGFNLTTYENILYWCSGYNSFEQLDDFEDFNVGMNNGIRKGLK